MTLRLVRAKRALALAALAVGLALIVPVVVALARPHTFMTVDGDDLADSLSRVGDGISVPEPCEHAARRYTDA